MPLEKDDTIYVLDMLTAARTVVAFTQNRSFEDYEKDLLLRSAVERQIEIVGEAARRVSVSFQKTHTHIPWVKIMAQRHVLAHDYGDIKHDRILASGDGAYPGVDRTTRTSCSAN